MSLSQKTGYFLRPGKNQTPSSKLQGSRNPGPKGTRERNQESRLLFLLGERMEGGVGPDV